MNIQVRKIANGYVISYPKIKVPSRAKAGEQAEYREPDSAGLYSSLYFLTQGYGSAPKEEQLEWYCSTQKQVEEAVPRIALECYHAMRLKDES